jgi:hypothetical protein
MGDEESGTEQPRSAPGSWALGAGRRVRSFPRPASEIGEQLFLSPKTVETYKQRISEKLGLTHRADYVQLCLRLGLLQAKA